MRPMVWLCNFPRGKVPLKDDTQAILTITAGRQTRYFSTGSPCGGPGDDQSYTPWDWQMPIVGLQWLAVAVNCPCAAWVARSYCCNLEVLMHTQHQSHRPLT